jgi:hypothetical protein
MPAKTDALKTQSSRASLFWEHHRSPTGVTGAICVNPGLGHESLGLPIGPPGDPRDAHGCAPPALLQLGYIRNLRGRLCEIYGVMPLEDSAESAGGRLGWPPPRSPKDGKRLLSHHWAS